MSNTSVAGRHILLVDDDPLVVKVYSQCMRSEGWTVAVARDGYEAAQEARARRFDLILLDLRMPVHDGYEVLSELRIRGPNTRTPVYVLTGVSEESNLTDALRRGADGIFRKAEVRPDQLVAMVDEILSDATPVASAERSDRPPASEASPAPDMDFSGYLKAATATASEEADTRAGREFVVHVNPFLGDGAVLSQSLGLPEPFTCRVCGGQICLRIRFDLEGSGLAGGFRCGRCDASV